MSVRWWSFVTWALVAASAVFWGLKLFVKPVPVPAGTAVAVNAPALRGDLTRLLGVDAPAPVAQAAAEPPPDARFQLIGVVAAKQPGAAREGVALIAIDGKPARAYRVGAAVDGQMVVQTVAALGVSLGPKDGAAQVNLNLQPMPPAATGSLPRAASDGGVPAPGSALAPTFAPAIAPAIGPSPRFAPGAVPGQMPVPAPVQQPQFQPQRRLVPPPQQQPLDAGNTAEGQVQPGSQVPQLR